MQQIIQDIQMVFHIKIPWIIHKYYPKTILFKQLYVKHGWIEEFNLNKQLNYIKD